MCGGISMLSAQLQFNSVVSMHSVLQLRNKFLTLCLFSIKEPEHHCGAGLVSGFAEAYSHQRRTDPECEQMSLTPAGAWQAGQVSTISPISVL